MGVASGLVEQRRGAGDLCANCDRSPRRDEHPKDEWRAEPDGRGGQHVFCPECWQREFGACATLGGEAPTRRTDSCMSRPGRLPI